MPSDSPFHAARVRRAAATTAGVAVALVATLSLVASGSDRVTVGDSASPAAVLDESTDWTPPQALRRVRTGGIAAPLPEGVVLVRAVGELRPGARERAWTFEPEEPEGVPRRTMGVLPSSALDDAAAQLTAMGVGARLRVELTGTVQLYRGRNFVLPAMVTPMGVERPARPTRRVPDADALEADEIERRLRERLGPLPRGTEGDAEIDVAAPNEGRVIRRRGTIRRDDETGGWRFVPEIERSADSAALGDPTMGLLPCRMLERIERVARTSETPRPLLITGEVVRFGDRVFLLPTAVEWPRTGRSLRPGGVAAD